MIGLLFHHPHGGHPAGAPGAAPIHAEVDQHVQHLHRQTQVFPHGEQDLQFLGAQHPAHAALDLAHEALEAAFLVFHPAGHVLLSVFRTLGGLLETGIPARIQAQLPQQGSRALQPRLRKPCGHVAQLRGAAEIEQGAVAVSRGKQLADRLH